MSDHECAYDTPGAGPCETCLTSDDTRRAEIEESLQALTPYGDKAITTITVGDLRWLLDRLAEVRAQVPPGPCWANAGVTWPNGITPRCELRAGHPGAHECDRGSMGGTAVWIDGDADAGEQP